MSRILIFAEAVTLAHVARPIALSRILRELGHEVCIAAAPAADRWLAGENIARQRIESIDSDRFLRALVRGLPVYDQGTLIRYVEEDLRAIAAWPPDIVIGDFRLSLYISARLARKPHGAIANAYWSRRYWTGVDAPGIAALNWLPSSVANAVFRGVYPAAFALHALPFHRACKSFGVKTPGLDIRDIYTASDVTAYADVEALYETAPGSAGAPLFIGPLAWKPPDGPPLPPIPEGPPIVFVSLGSSGAEHLLPRVLAALAPLPIRLIVATGLAQATAVPENCVHAARFVAYADACAAASLVVCNGGAPAVYAALTAAKPVVGMAGNLDQLLNLRAIERTAACRSLSSRGSAKLGVVIMDALADREMAASAMCVRQAIMTDPDSRVAIAGWLMRLGETGTPSTGFTKAS